MTVLMLIPIIIERGAPFFIIATDGFGFASGAAAVTLVIRRRRFMLLNPARQMLWAGIAWALHVAAFFLLLAAAWR